MIDGPVILRGFWAKSELSPFGNYVYKKIEQYDKSQTKRKSCNIQHRLFNF